MPQEGTVDSGALAEALEDLLVQATRERSHFYVAKVARDALAYIKQLEGNAEDSNAQKLKLWQNWQDELAHVEQLEGERDNLNDNLARVQRHLQYAVSERNWLREALDGLRGAWNEHFKTCSDPTFNRIITELSADTSILKNVREWMDAPSDTASA